MSEKKSNASRPVSRVLYGALRRAMTIPLGRPFPAASSNQPGRRPGEGWVQETLSSLFGFAPGGACHAADVAARAVRSYRTLSPLPPIKDLSLAEGGLLSVALSLGSPPPDVIRRRFSVEPGLSSIPERTAAIQPTDPPGITGEPEASSFNWLWPRSPARFELAELSRSAGNLARKQESDAFGGEFFTLML
jgi:hypothetical protein